MILVTDASHKLPFSILKPPICKISPHSSEQTLIMEHITEHPSFGITQLTTSQMFCLQICIHFIKNIVFNYLPIDMLIILEVSLISCCIIPLNWVSEGYTWTWRWGAVESDNHACLTEIGKLGLRTKECAIPKSLHTHSIHLYSSAISNSFLLF